MQKQYICPLSAPSDRLFPLRVWFGDPLFATYLKGRDIIFDADCVPFSYRNFHEDFLKGNSVLIGCPKFENVNAYIEKIKQIIEVAKPKSFKVIYMEVPCCFGIVYAVKEALEKTGADIPFDAIKISLKGTIKKYEENVIQQ